MVSKRVKNRIVAIALLAMSCLLVCGCNTSSDEQKVVTEINKKVEDKFQPPFSDITFDTSMEDMLLKEGTAVEEYPSVYNGTVYRFANKEYCGLNGSVKYMTDDKGNIACIAWLYENDDSEAINKAYERIHSELISKYGESGNDSESQGTYGDLWYFDNVHIQISAVVTSDYKGLQLSYMNSKYSLKEVVDQKKQERESGQ